MAEKVSTKDQVREIWAADQRLLGLAAKGWAAILDGDHAEARRIREVSNTIKREIRNKYDVIID